MPSCIEEDVIRFTVNLPSYDSIFYKSLARNDHQWVHNDESHQSGVVIPRETLEFFGFSEFPDENTTLELNMTWFLRGEEHTRKEWDGNHGWEYTRLKYYCEGNRASRPESHLTCVYNPYFENLNDGAVLVIGRREVGPEEYEYDALIVDTDHHDLLEDIVEVTGIPDAPSWGIVQKEVTGKDIGIDLYEKIQGRAKEVYEEVGDLPTTKRTSTEIWTILENNPELIRGKISCPGLAQSKSPFQTALKNAPGNLVRWMLQKLEYKFLRVIEKLHYPQEFISKIKEKYGSDAPQNWGELKEAIGVSLDDVVEVSKSLTQSRRARAGSSFEWYINNILETFNYNFERQAGTRKIDFRLHVPDDFIQLSAKTTTRDRWKQVHKNSYFITLDRTIPESKLEKILDADLVLVVPEEDKKEIGHFSSSESVLSFSEFFQQF